jgi:hypothetical protein
MGRLISVRGAAAGLSRSVSPAAHGARVGAATSGAPWLPRACADRPDDERRAWPGSTAPALGVHCGMHRTFGLGLLLIVLATSACGQRHSRATPPEAHDGNAARSGTLAPAPLAAAGAGAAAGSDATAPAVVPPVTSTSTGAALPAVMGQPTHEHGVVARVCSRPPYGSDWLLVPTSTDCGPRCRTGTECARNEDCRAAPHGSCIGIADRICVYDADASDTREPCQQDSDCNRAASGRCPKELRFTFCRYDKCSVDADCANGQRCQCPDPAADPICVTDGCDTDTACPAGQSCRVDQSYSGAPAERHCSTTADGCASRADCPTRPNDSCGFDTVQQRWLCRPYAMVD